MDTIRLVTWVDAPVERCCLLSLSIDLRVDSARSSGERVVDGVASGLIGEGETVTFEGRHLGTRLRYANRIEVLRPYSYFRDVVVSGAFGHFEHEHHFAPMNDGTRIREEIRFAASWGIMGRLATMLYVRRHLTAFLTERNAAIKRVAESEDWHRYLDGRPKPVVSVTAKDALTSGWKPSTTLRSSRG
jgi:hypothetical protein